MLIHEIKPVFDKDSKVLILGSFPSPKSREQGFFYGHPQNRMWIVLANVLGQEIPKTVEEKRNFLLKNKIAMWDVLASCEIVGASDASIKDEKPNDLRLIIEKSSIKLIVTAGKKATSYFEKYQKGFYEIKHIEMPSTSPANATFSLDKLCRAYSVIKDYLE